MKKMKLTSIFILILFTASTLFAQAPEDIPPAENLPNDSDLVPGGSPETAPTTPVPPPVSSGLPTNATSAPVAPPPADNSPAVVTAPAGKPYVPYKIKEAPKSNEPTNQGKSEIQEIVVKKKVKGKKKVKQVKRIYAIMRLKAANVTRDIKIRLYHQRAPKTVANFVGLAEGKKDYIVNGKTLRNKFYDGLKIHRIIAGFMIHGGAPKGTGTNGGPGYTFADEFHPALVHNRAGMVSMANYGVNTNGSQFFITVSAQPHLNRRHTLFGEVVEGLDWVIKLSNLPAYRRSIKRRDQPKIPITIVSVKIKREY